MIELSKETRQAINQVYMYLFSALLLSTGVVVYLTNNQELLKFLTTGWAFVSVLVASFIAVIAIGLVADSRSGRVAAICLYAFSVLFSVLTASIVSKYTTTSIVNCFLAATILFAVMGIYGMVTKKDISNWGSMLLFALIAVIAISIVNVFVGSSALEMILSAITVIIFMAFNAHDHQMMVSKLDGNHTHGDVIMSAANLYLNFVNIFIHLLSLFGDE